MEFTKGETDDGRRTTGGGGLPRAARQGFLGEAAFPSTLPPRSARWSTMPTSSTKSIWLGWFRRKRRGAPPSRRGEGVAELRRKKGASWSSALQKRGSRRGTPPEEGLPLEGRAPASPASALYRGTCSIAGRRGKGVAELRQKKGASCNSALSGGRLPPGRAPASPSRNADFPVGLRALQESVVELCPEGLGKRRRRGAPPEEGEASWNFALRKMGGAAGPIVPTTSGARFCKCIRRRGILGRGGR
jgi:hypothetical protein